MRPIATLFVLALALVALPRTASLDALSGALVTLALGVLSAVVIAGRSALSITLGSIGALAYTYLAPKAPELAAALFVAGAHGARSIRGRSLALRGAHTLTALLGGLLGGAILARYADAEPGVIAAASIVGALLAAMPLAIPADDAITFALQALASESDEPARALLMRAVAIRRRVDAATIDVLPPSVSTQLEASWAALLETANARATSRASAALLLDKRIARFVDALDRIYTAAEERAARAAGLDDKALLAAKMEGDRLEAEVAALIEVSTAVRVETDAPAPTATDLAAIPPAQAQPAASDAVSAPT